MKKNLFVILLFFLLLTGCDVVIGKRESLIKCEEAYKQLNEVYDYKNDYLVLYCLNDYYVFNNDKSILINKDNIKMVNSDYASKTIKISKAKSLGLAYLEVMDHNETKALVYSHYTYAFGRNVYFFISGSIDNPISIYSDKYECKQLNLMPSDGYINYIPYFDNVSQVFYRPSDSQVKNIIFMVPDGGGYDNLTLAGEVKEEVFNRGLNKLSGARTTLTNDLLNEYGYNPKGLYLDEFLVGSANTLLYTPHNGSYITDSSAAGTALSSGYKTSYCYSGIDSDCTPHSSITELARANGMSTGIVSTKAYTDATPLAFLTSHSIYRYEYHDNSLQALLSGCDVVICEGTEYGDVLTSDSVSNHPDVSASKVGYDVATNKDDLFALVNNKRTKIFAPILGVSNSNKHIQKDSFYGVAADHIAYDIQESSTNPTLLEMTKAAIDTLSININNPNGFFLMIEGGALDNAAEGGNFREAIGEALAFDEAFAYAVKWAKDNGDNTIVVACPDHDSGGFSNIENYKDSIIDTIITGKNQEGIEIGVNYNYKKYNQNIKLHGGHTDMPVPIFLYARKDIKENILSNLGLPVNTNRDDIRYKNTDYGNYYVGNTSPQSDKNTINPVINTNYLIQNSDLIHGIIKESNMGSLEALDSIRFVKVLQTDANGNVVNSIDGAEIIFGNEYQTKGYVSFYIDATLKIGNIYCKRDNDNYEVNNTIIESKEKVNLFVLTKYGQNQKEGSFYVSTKFITDNGLGSLINFIRGPEDVKGIMNSLCFINGETEFIIPDNKFSYENYTFIGFTDGNKIYKPGEIYKITNPGEVNLTCVWE